MPAPAATFTAALSIRERGRIRVAPPDAFGVLRLTLTLPLGDVTLALRASEAHALAAALDAALRTDALTSQPRPA